MNELFLFNPSLVLVALAVFIAIVIVAAMICDTVRSSPRFKCKHDMITEKVFDGPITQTYLSTCRHCGKQKEFSFSGARYKRES
jgi:hypothetical protein